MLGQNKYMLQLITSDMLGHNFDINILKYLL